MSLSLHDELRVVLYRDQVQLVLVKCGLTFGGISYRMLEKKIYPCTEDIDSPWGNAVKRLEIALSELSVKPAFARVILSNHFIRYAIVPWSENLNSETEEIAYAKHCFSNLYGANVESWELRMNQDFAGAPQFASALDAELLLTLRELFGRSKVKLKSVQPYLMTAYNNCHSSLQKHAAWFVLFEQGSLCLGLVEKGHWKSVRTIKVGNDWLDRLPEILDRESQLSELETSSDEIFLWAPEQWTSPIPSNARWKIHKLQPVIHPGIALEYDARYAMAMCG